MSANVYDEDGNATAHVGDMRFVAVDPDESADPYGLLAGEDGNLSRIARVIFNRGSGGLAEDVDESLEPLGNRILIVDLVRLEPVWRGFGIGALLTASAIKMLSGGVRAVVCYPDPVDEPGDPAAGTSRSAQRKEAIQALGTVASRIGFEPFRDGVWVLDLNLVTFEDCLDGLRTEAQRYERG